MNKAKMKFMQNAPSAVIVGGLTPLGCMFLGGLAMCLTGGWRFGLFLIILIGLGVGVILHAVRRCEKVCKMPFDEVVAKERRYWETHDK